MLQHIESLSLLLDNFLLYIFYQAMFVKKKKEIHIIWLLLAFAGVDIVYWFFASSAFGSISIDSSVLRTSLTILLNFAITFFYTSNMIYRILVVLSYTAIVIISENLSYFIIMHFTDNSIKLYELPDTTFLSISLISDLIIFLLTMMITVSKRPKYTVRSKIYTLLLLIIPALSCVLTYIPAFFKLNFIEPMAYLTLVIFLLIINVTNYILLQNVLRAEVLSRETSFLQQQISFQRNKYQQLSDAYKNIRGFMHDTKKHLFYIEQCVNEEEYSKIIPYTRQTMSDLESRYCSVNTGNLVIDAFVSNIILQAASHGVQLTTKLRVEKDLIPCDDYHMTIILGNLLDNAMNACIDQTGGCIDLNIQTVENSFVIHITNTYHLPPYENYSENMDNFDFIHGYGLKNVKNSAEACGGFCIIKYNGAIYSATVIVPLKEPKLIT